ncbi:MAG: hypothetical protein HGA53_05370, partial [Anaerolineaceae bacterium]|nr:hypothetical protein [Anaerolineaceae bacterium]
MLTIFETLMILVLDDDEGEVLDNYQKSIEYVVTGAVLAELFMMKRITLTDHRVDVVDHTPTGHAIMNKA